MTVEPIAHNGRLLVGTGPDRGATLHFGDPVKEQRALAEGKAWADLSHLEIIAVKGVDRLRWLHDLTTQHLETFTGGWSDGLILDHLGHIEHQFLIFDSLDSSETAWLIVDVDRAAPLIEYLNKMRFTMRVEVRDASNEKSLIRIPGLTDDLGGPYQLVNRGELPDFSGATQVGIWALEAERVEKMRPRLGLETDHKSIPNEIGVLNKSVHMNKGCYRGQETVAKVHNLGQPPRKLVLLHLDGSEVDLPAVGADVERDGIKVGFIGTVARHYELGNIALAVVKRNVKADSALLVNGIAAKIN
ncbi:MAG: YgfZ/GcvT domain-containing protein [Candidatus Nanopelagicaceae bacterium]